MRSALFVGGPADGQTREVPDGVGTVTVPVPGPRGFGAFAYTMRQCTRKNRPGSFVWLLVPAGRQVDRDWLQERSLKN